MDLLRNPICNRRTYHVAAVIPGVVVGFMIIMLGGRNGLIGMFTQGLGAGKLVFAYGMAGLFLGYLYFSIPRVVTTVMAAARNRSDVRGSGANARSLVVRILKDVTLPALAPALFSTGALCFATSMGAFGTAFTLATDINVLPITIYTELPSANIASAAMPSVVLGLITWIMLVAARHFSGSSHRYRCRLRTGAKQCQQKNPSTGRCLF